MHFSGIITVRAGSRSGVIHNMDENLEPDIRIAIRNIQVLLLKERENEVVFQYFLLVRLRNYVR